MGKNARVQRHQTSSELTPPPPAHSSWPGLLGLSRARTTHWPDCTLGPWFPPQRRSQGFGVLFRARSAMRSSKASQELLNFMGSPSSAPPSPWCPWYVPMSWAFPFWPSGQKIRTFVTKLTVHTFLQLSAGGPGEEASGALFTLVGSRLPQGKRTLTSLTIVGACHPCCRHPWIARGLA